jgi:prepilin-type N-terminal cleavage/methylation domain-containing protein
MKHQPHSNSNQPARRGFTLIEMLVSVTLVLLMMTMFASIFQMATNSVSVQRGIAKNDQRTRTLTTIIRSDFQKRTFRYGFPFYPGEDSATSPTPFGNRSGYVYISTNDPANGLDDLIQFTVDVNILIENSDDTPIFGRAAILDDRRTDNPPATSATGLSVSPNQPDADDGNLSANGVGVSTKAEVSIFVRNGSLYRRVVLIREPLAVAGLDFTPQPTSRSGYNFFSGQPDTTDPTTYDGAFSLGGTLTNDFYRFFDYAAFPTFSGPGNQSAKFIGIEALTNEQTSSGAATEAFGNAVYRFGFNPFTGLSREHTAVGGLFLGRFLQSETSSPNFNWPQNICVAEGDPEVVPLNPPPWATGAGLQGNPYDILDTTLTLNTFNGLVSEFDDLIGAEGRGGTRRVEDILLANVHEMRIEMWDDRLQRFTTPGHLDANPITGEAGDYHISRNLNPAWGPLGPGSLGRIFDTGHPAPTVDSDGDGVPLELRANPNPPYLAYRFYPPHLNDTPPGPSPNGTPGPNRDYWVSGTHNLGDIVFARKFGFDGVAGWDSDGDGIFEWDQDAAAIPGQAFQVAYRCIGTNDADSSGGFDSGALIPVFPAVPGRRVTDGELIWESFDNRRPLQSIRLTIRFMDQTADSMRQLSLIIPLTDEE